MDYDDVEDEEEEASLEKPGGYGNPPHSTRWPKGFCPNPHGRPRKAKNRKSLLEKIALERRDYTRGGRKRRAPTLELVIEQIRHKTAAGDPLGAALSDWLQGWDQEEEQPVQRAVLITPPPMTHEEWDAKYGHLGDSPTEGS